MTESRSGSDAPALEEAETLRTARSLASRWDAQQTGYIRHRAERFDTIARVVAAICKDSTAPRILDLAGGTGSLAAHILSAVPNGRAVVADKDPALLAIATDLAAADPRLSIAEVDLAQDDWTAHPHIVDGPFDAVVSSTALHWLQPADLVEVYRALPDLLRPGGIVLNGDHLSYSERHEPTLAGIAQADDEAMQQETFSGDADTWDDWWEAVAATPRYADALSHRDQVWGASLHQAPPKVTLGFHLETLRSAGFSETGTVWQYLDDYVLYGVIAS